VISLVPLEQVGPDRVDELLDGAFGPDRHERTAYRVRGGATAIGPLSFAALDGETLVGTIQCWPVMLAADAPGVGDLPLVMVGPVAVEPSRQRDGIGRRLVARVLEAAAETGSDSAMMLIGDPEYYGRFFGFSAERTGQWRLPGPVEMRRLLARGDAVPACAGLLGPVADPVPDPVLGK
jgi:predicted N-acetyltransferase YhbS